MKCQGGCSDEAKYHCENQGKGMTADLCETCKDQWRRLNTESKATIKPIKE